MADIRVPPAFGL